MSETNPSDKEQKLNAERELREAMAAREEERRSRARRYGILNRKEELSLQTAKLNRLLCNCGAILRGGLHKDSCPVIKEARSKR